eukprot:TRINITY_DN10213_c0_g2_i1.p1 TRINITY_DN10213_c0_g2~~TRINITY_DN10213_c0_g2_i1.p1  ORF type:complete len:445 (+),score=81.35 TRINITY_DN10213_c0_g2_i1:147-1481(+)
MATKAAARASKDEIIAVFRKFDTNGDGTIEKKELAELLMKLDAKMWSDKAVDTLLHSADLDCDGHINANEFIHYVFSDECGQAAFQTVFEVLPERLRTRLFEAARRRTSLFNSASASGLSVEALACLRRLKELPPPCISLMSAVCWLLFGESLNADEACMSFQKLCFAKPSAFMRALLDPPTYLSTEVLDKVEVLITEAPISRDAIAKVASDPFPGLAEWVTVVMDIHRALREFDHLPASQGEPVGEHVQTVVAAQPNRKATGRRRVESKVLPSQAAISATAAATGASKPVGSNVLPSQAAVSATAAATGASKPWASAVSRISRNDLVELKTMTRPPTFIRTVLAAVCWLLTGQGFHDPDFSWRLSQQMIMNPTRFLRQLTHPTPPSSEAVNEAEKIVATSRIEFTAERGADVSVCISALVEWVLEVLRVARLSDDFERASLPT